LAIVLSVLRRFTSSDYPIGTFKSEWQSRMNNLETSATLGT